MERSSITLSPVRDPVMYIGYPRCRLTLSPPAKPNPKTAKLPFRLPADHEEAALCRLRKQYAVKSDTPAEDPLFPIASDNQPGDSARFRCSLMRKSAKTTEKPIKSLSPDKPPMRQSVVSQAKTVLKKSETPARVALVTVGDEVLMDTGRTEGSGLEQQYRAWAVYQMERSAGKKGANSKIPIQTSPALPELTPEQPEKERSDDGRRKEVTTEALAKFLRPGESGSASPKRESWVRSRVLNFAVQNCQSFLPCSLTKLPPSHSPKCKPMPRPTPPRASLSSRDFFSNAEFPPPPQSIATDRAPLRTRSRLKGDPRLLVASKDVPLHRHPVEFNLFRNVFKHKERPPGKPKTFSSTTAL